MFLLMFDRYRTECYTLCTKMMEGEMNYNFGTLRVERVIIHDIPRHKAGEEGIEPDLSEVESNLTQELKNYFREKINGSITSSSAFDIVIDSSTSSPVPQLVCDCVNNNGQDFVNISQQIARHLFQMQSGINSKGLLAFVDCSLEGQRAISILKLEREEGVRLLTTTIGGKHTFDLDLIRQLMLTGKTRLFKIGLFVQPGTTTETIEGVACDYQRFAATTEIADFFLSRFLGCRLTLVSNVATKQFFLTTEQFCNEEVPDPTLRAEYLTHLFSELTSQRSSINPRTFAEDNFQVTDRQKFLEYLGEHEIPITAFNKDTNLIDTRIKLMSIQFLNGINITAPNDVFQERVQLTQLETGDTRAEITDRVKHVGSK